MLTENYRNRLMYVKVIANDKMGNFSRHCVHVYRAVFVPINAVVGARDSTLLTVDVRSANLSRQTGARSDAESVQEGRPASPQCTSQPSAHIPNRGLRIYRSSIAALSLPGWLVGRLRLLIIIPGNG